MDILQIIGAIRSNQVRISDHADEEATADRLSIDEVYSAVLHGEIIEDYPSDWPYPSCLIAGQIPTGDPVHSVWAYNQESGRAVLVTVYRPDPRLWLNWRTRREPR